MKYSVKFDLFWMRSCMCTVPVPISSDTVDLSPTHNCDHV